MQNCNVTSKVIKKFNNQIRS